MKTEPIDELRAKRDRLIRELWITFADISNTTDCDDWPEKDLRLWGAVIAHSAVQGPLARSI